MHLSFGKLRIQHFALFREEQVIDLGCGPGLFYVRGVNQVEPKLGMNDCGKSTLFKAMLYCLYGQASPQLKSTDIKPWDDDGKLQVSLEVFRGDPGAESNRNVFTRGGKPSQILVNGSPAGQELIDKLLGLSFETFTNTILLAQGADLFLDLTPANKMKMFSDVLGLDKWDARSRFASETAKELTNRQANWSGELTGLESSRDQLKDLEAKAKADAEAWEATRQEVLTKADREIAVLETDIEKVQRIVDEAVLSGDGAGTEAKALRNEIEKQGQIFFDHELKLTEIKGLATNSERGAKQNRIELSKLAKAKICPTCGQKIKGNLIKHATELESEYKQLTTEFGQFKRQQAALETTIEKLRDVRKKTLERLREFTDREDRARDVLANSRPKLLGYQNKASLLRQQRDQYRSDDNPHQAQLRDLRRRRAKVDEELDVLREDLTKLARRLERTQYWVRGFKEVQLQVIDETLQELEMATNATLPEMGLEDWSISYSVERETKSGTVRNELNATVLSPYNDGPVRWESWGGGVGQRLRVAGSLALSEVLLNHAGVTCDLECLDEPSRHMSDQGIDDLIEMLADRARRLGKTIFLVEHRLVESTAFAGTVTVTKTKLGSLIKND